MKPFLLSITAKISMLCLVVILLASGCEDLPSRLMSKEEDEARLVKLKNEITELSESVACEDEENWRFVAIGAKACGGPTGFVAYSMNIDTNAFKKKVKLFSQAQQDFNKKWGAVSDCSVPPTPKEIKCENGKPVFLYTNPGVMMLGTWRLTETLADPGNGSGRYTPVTGAPKYLTFDNKGNVSGAAIPDLHRYRFIDHQKIEFTKSEDFKLIFRYQLAGDDLELNPPCIEACGYKFKRVY